MIKLHTIRFWQKNILICIPFSSWTPGISPLIKRRSSLIFSPRIIRVDDSWCHNNFTNLPLNFRLELELGLLEPEPLSLFRRFFFLNL